MAQIPPPLPWKQLGEADPAQEYLVVLTHLPVRRLTALPRFLSYVRKIQRQLDAGPDGLVGYSLLAKPHRSRYWTLSAWLDAAALQAFMREPPHRDAMATLRQVLKGFETKKWMLSGAALPPSWEDALART